MTTITDVPHEVLSIIIFLLVQSSDGAKQFARILSVCKTFLVFKQDVHILKVVRFEKECCKYQMLQEINGLAVRCSEAGNISAQFLIGKAILLNCPQLFSSTRQSTRMGSFMSYFLPSEVSQTRLVHHQLVKVFLLHCSHHELFRMVKFVRIYIYNFSGVTKEQSSFVDSVDRLLLYASHLTRREKVFDLKKRYQDSYRVSTELQAKYEEELRSECHDPSSSSTEMDYHASATKTTLLFRQFMSGCAKAAIHFLEAINGEACNNCLKKAQIDFDACRVQTLLHYDRCFS